MAAREKTETFLLNATLAVIVAALLFMACALAKQGRGAEVATWRPCRDGQCSPHAPREAAQARPAQPHPGIVRIRFTPQGGNETRHGTGTILAANETHALVITCAHTFLPENGPTRRLTDQPLPGLAEVRTAAGETIPAELIRSDTVLDLAALEIPRPAGAFRAVPIAEDFSKPGELLSAFGYAGPAAQLGMVAGTARGYRSATAGGSRELLQMTGRSVGGYSGGPMLTAAGDSQPASELAGVIIGSNADGIIGAYSGAVETFVAGLISSPHAPREEAPQAASAPSGISTPDRASEPIQIALPGPAGPQGPRGETGPAGPRGPTGPRGETIPTGLAGNAASAPPAATAGSSLPGLAGGFLQSKLAALLIAVGVGGIPALAGAWLGRKLIGRLAGRAWRRVRGKTDRTAPPPTAPEAGDGNDRPEAPAQPPAAGKGAPTKYKQYAAELADNYEANGGRDKLYDQTLGRLYDLALDELAGAEDHTLRRAYRELRERVEHDAARIFTKGAGRSANAP